MFLQIYQKNTKKFEFTANNIHSSPRPPHLFDLFLEVGIMKFCQGNEIGIQRSGLNSAFSKEIVNRPDQVVNKNIPTVINLGIKKLKG